MIETFQLLEANIKELENERTTIDEQLTAFRTVLQSLRDKEVSEIEPEDSDCCSPARVETEEMPSNGAPDWSNCTWQYPEGTMSHRLVPAIHESLWEHGPLSRKQILAHVEAKGIHIGGKRPGDTISPYLRRDPCIIRAGQPARWQLAAGWKGSSNGRVNGKNGTD